MISWRRGESVCVCVCLCACTYRTCLFKGLGSHGQFIKRGQTNVNTHTNTTFNLFSRRRKDLYAYTDTLFIRWHSGIFLTLWFTYTWVYTLCKVTLFYGQWVSYENATHPVCLSVQSTKLRANIFLCLIAVLAAFLLGGMHLVTFLLGFFSGSITPHIPSSRCVYYPG